MNIIFKVLVLLLFTSGLLTAKTVIVPIDGTIDLGMPLIVERGVKEAEDMGADYIVFKINTFGGRVDAATNIKDVIMSTDIKTVAYINNRAISAGALISLSCDSVIMASSSSIGAVTPVDQNGTKLSEKQVSYMRAEMRSTMEKNNRNPLIGEAMVDESIEIDSISEKGKLLTLTSKEALKYGICDTITDDIEAYLGIDHDDVTVIEESFKENVIRVLSNPMVSSLLLIAGLLGIFFELKAPGFGFPGVLGISSLTIYIFSHYVLRLANWFEISLIIIGLVLLALEAFVIPGFGVAGIVGSLLVLGGLYFTMLSDMPIQSDYVSASWGLFAVIIVSVIGAVFLFNRLIKSDFYKKRALVEEEEVFEKAHVIMGNENIHIGECGVVVTVLKPSGKIEIEDVSYEAISDGGFLEKGTAVKVVGRDGNVLKVKQIKES